LERNKEHGKPNQIIGWQGGDSGSIVQPPEYQKLASKWVDGKDPAEGIASRNGLTREIQLTMRRETRLLVFFHGAAGVWQPVI
jgi:hypothetical protein